MNQERINQIKEIMLAFSPECKTYLYECFEYINTLEVRINDLEHEKHYLSKACDWQEKLNAELQQLIDMSDSQTLVHLERITKQNEELEFYKKYYDENYEDPYNGN